jgi:hypothetical protein
MRLETVQYDGEAGDLLCDFDVWILEHSRSNSKPIMRAWRNHGRRFETVQLNDSVLEVLILNSHDGTSAYLRLKSIRNHRMDLPEIQASFADSPKKCGC